MAGEAFRRLPLQPPVIAQTDALWVRIDADGRAFYGGVMPLPEVPAALRFLADHIERLLPEETPPTTS